MNRFCWLLLLINMAVSRTHDFTIVTFLQHPSSVFVDESREVFTRLELLEFLKVLVDEEVFPLFIAQRIPSWAESRF
jgi:hypothetical protein